VFAVCTKYLRNFVIFWIKKNSDVQIDHFCCFFSLVRISSNVGKVDILLTKASPGEEWKTLGKPLDGDNSLKPHKTRGNYFIRGFLDVQLICLTAKILCIILSLYTYIDLVF
jgi:hypothetical protein